MTPESSIVPSVDRGAGSALASTPHVPSTESSRRPLISVIIIFLNAQEFIREAIESVFAQTYSAWELLLVDDGSTDAGTGIAKGYAERYPSQVRYFEHDGHTNRGMSASRNVGIAQARGEFVAFLDADDIWLPHKLEKQVAVVTTHSNVQLLVNPALYWYTDGRKMPQEMTLSAGWLPPGAWLPKILESDTDAACPSAVLLRRSFATRLGGFEESFRGLFEDQVMWLKATLGAAVFYDPQCLMLYRIHPASCCGEVISSSQHLPSRIRAYAWLGAYLRKENPHRIVVRSIPLRTMAAAKLYASLLELPRRVAEESGEHGTHQRSRLRSIKQMQNSYAPSLGAVSSGLLLVGAMFPRAAKAIVHMMFVLSKVAYSRSI